MAVEKPDEVSAAMDNTKIVSCVKAGVAAGLGICELVLAGLSIGHPAPSVAHLKSFTGGPGSLISLPMLRHTGR